MRSDPGVDELAAGEAVLDPGDDLGGDHVALLLGHEEVADARVNAQAAVCGARLAVEVDRVLRGDAHVVVAREDEDRIDERLAVLLEVIDALREGVEAGDGDGLERPVVTLGRESRELLPTGQVGRAVGGVHGADLRLGVLGARKPAEVHEVVAKDAGTEDEAANFAGMLRAVEGGDMAAHAVAQDIDRQTGALGLGEGDDGASATTETVKYFNG